jgi:hypothetical protein
MRILRQKQFLKAEKKRKKKEARQNERKREEAEKLKQDQVGIMLLLIKTNLHCQSITTMFSAISPYLTPFFYMTRKIEAFLLTVKVKFTLTVHVL